jgi:spore coat polysaccharide biosynthesis protein SpsF
MILAIIQARMGSTRLPGKVLMEVNNKPLLSYQLDRVLKSKKLDKIVIATSTFEKDDAIEDFCFNYGIDCYRGSEDDVLSRYYECAREHNPDTLVRITADCPLADPQIIDDVIAQYENSDVEYCANTVPIETNTFPDGMDVEVFSMGALEKAYKEVQDPHFREHVTFQFWQTDEYTSTQYIGDKDYSKYRITVDYPEDFEVVEFIFNELAIDKSFGHLDKIIEIIDSNEEIKNKNSNYYFGQGWQVDPNY